MSLEQLQEKRLGVVAKMNTLVDAHPDGFNAENQEAFNKMNNDIDSIQNGIDARIKVRALEKESIAKKEMVVKPTVDAKNLRFEAFDRYLRGGEKSLTTDMRNALQADSETAGGYLQPGEQFVNELLKGVDDMVFMRQKARVVQVPNAESLGIPTLDNRPSDAAWTAEVGTISQDSTMSFGKRSLTPHLLSQGLTVSEKFLRVSVLPAESIVREELTLMFGRVMENNFLTGSGAAEPLGVFTPSANGISTSQDVSTGNTATSVTFDGLINALYSLKGQYQTTGEWLFHRDVIKEIRKLKDGSGQYLWQTSQQAGQPDMLLGRPVNMSEYAPSTFQTGLYVGMFADFSKYMIADSMGLRIQRLDELYAASSQIGFHARMESDGMPVLEEAFARVTLA